MMKNQADENEYSGTDDDWSLAGPLPDFVYIKKLVRRHIAFAVKGLGISVISAVVIALGSKNLFESKIHAVFDQTDISGSGMGVSSQASYNIVSRLFVARFNSQDFLYQVAKDLGIDKELRAPKFPLNVFDSEGNKFPLNMFGLTQAEPSTPEEITKEKIAIADFMKKHIKVEAEPYTGILNLSSYAETSNKAADLATVAMNLFIKQELEFQLQAVEKKLSLLSTGVESVTVPDEKEASSDDSSSQQDQLKKLQIREQENMYENELKRLTLELDRNQTMKKNVTAAHNSEMDKLLASLQPNHPTVRSKVSAHRVKIAALKATEAKLTSRAATLRQELWRTKVNKVRTEGSMIPTGEGLTYQGAFFIAVSDRIKDLSLERKNLLRQIRDPEQRTRIKILFPATIEQIPFKSNRRTMAVVVSLIGGMLVFAIILFREVKNPIARDDWRIMRRINRPILTQIALESKLEFERITPGDADRLRSLFSQGPDNNDGLRTLLSYRRLELAISQSCIGDTILLASSGSKDELGSSIFSFLNILATDTDQRLLVIDFNGDDPIYLEPESKGDIIDVIEGKALTENIIRKGENEIHQFDIIPPFKDYQGERTRAFTFEKLNSIIKSISNDYDLLFLRSFPERQFTENVVLSRIASDSLVCVDAEMTSFNELDRTLTHIDSEKLRGLVLVGT